MRINIILLNSAHSHRNTETVIKEKSKQLEDSATCYGDNTVSIGNDSQESVKHDSFNDAH